MSVMQIIEENALGFREKNELYSLTEAEVSKISNYMVTSLYKNAINKAHINFEDIPKSEGKISNYEGTATIKSVLDILSEICRKENMKKPEEIDTLATAIINLERYEDLFEKGFKLKKEFVILNYNLLVMAVVEATSNLLTEFIDFVKRPDMIEFKIKPSKIKSGDLIFNNLRNFNNSCKNGEFSKVMNGIIASGKEEFLGMETTAMAGVIMIASLTIIPIIRELIYYFYMSRVKTSEYLKQQVMFLEMNKNNVDSLKKSAREKQTILKKQEEIKKKMLDMSDKISLDKNATSKKVIDTIKQENKQYKLADVQHDMAQSDSNGFQLL